MSIVINTNDSKILVADIEDQLCRIGISLFKKGKRLSPEFSDFENIIDNSDDSMHTSLQEYIFKLLEMRGPKRPSGKIDTVCFYENCCISATTWSNFMNGKYSENTIKKIIAGLKCNMTEATEALALAGFTLTDSRADRLVIAAIMSGHHNTQDMYVILDYYSEQYPSEVKNYYKSDI